MQSTIHAVRGQQKGQNRAKSHVWVIFLFYFLVKRAGRHFGFFKRAERHEKGAGRRALQNKHRQNTAVWESFHILNHDPTSSFLNSQPIQAPPSGPGLICFAGQVVVWDNAPATPLNWSFTKGCSTHLSTMWYEHLVLSTNHWLTSVVGGQSSQWPIHIVWRYHTEIWCV